MISTLQKDGFMKIYSFKNIIYIQANALTYHPGLYL